MSDSLLRVNSLDLRIGRDCSLEVDELALSVGDQLCVLGGNGSGKTMLARLLAGVVRAPRGAIERTAGFEESRDVHWVSFEEQQRLWERENRHDISEFEPRAMDVGTTVETLIRGVRARDAHDEGLFDELLSRLSLATLRDRGCRYLSSGQIRRALIARAFYAARGDHCQLLLLDDPLASIDRQSQALIRASISALRPGNSVLVELCRRPQDRLAGASHLALMGIHERDGVRRMQVLASGPAAIVESCQAYREFCAPSRFRPDMLDSLLAEQARKEALIPSDGTPLLHLRDVSASYGENRVLSSLNWEMRPQDNVLLAGPNGCGKSTLLALIDGDSHKGYGQDLWLFGRRKGSGETLWETKRYFGVVSNELHNRYLKGWRAGEVVLSGFFDSEGLYTEAGSSQVALARRWLGALCLPELFDRPYAGLSFGQQRLVLLARAMVKSPRILVLDEACVGLDNEHREIVLRSVDRVVERTRTRLLFVSHSVDELPSSINREYGFERLADGSHTLVERTRDS